MRWGNVKKSEFPYGQRRFVTSFLWWPKCIQRETRWLEFATWEEVCYKEEYNSFRDCFHPKWLPTEWRNEQV